MFLIFGINSIAQQISLTGKVINPDEKPVKKVLVYLANNPSVYCYSDTLGNFSLTNISTSVSEVMQDKIISFENRKLSVYAYNQSIAVDVFTIDGRQVKNIVNMRYCLGTFGLYPEAYLSELPKAIYIVRVIVGNTVQSFKIQNLIPTAFPQGITDYDINNIIDTYITESKSEADIETKSEALDTLVLVHDFYKSRKIPIDSYSIQYDTIHLNNFADYSIAEGFEPSVTYLNTGYANFTNIFSAYNVRFLIDYDTLSLLNGDLKVITIPVDKIENLESSIKFISGLHFEPSGTNFIQPIQVTTLIKDSIPKNLVVFQCNEKGETYFIPYISTYAGSGRYCIIFNINHFSSIGIGTGLVVPTNPEGFTTSDQFISYLAQFANNFGEIPVEIFTVWFNNVVVPMINKIITYDDLCAALREFGIIGKEFILSGGDSINDLPFFFTAMEMFCEKMTKVWNDCVVEYNGLTDNCLKREILKIALNILALNQLNGDICKDFSESDLNDFGNGEYYNLANKIEFVKQVKHLEVGGSYAVEYTLKCISGNPIPEIVNWSSSNPLVATINADGTVTGISNGETIITGKICDIENTLKVYVGGVNCENDYCYNKNKSCYSGRYICTSVASRILSSDQCGVYLHTERITIAGNLEISDLPSYHEVIQTSDHHYYNDLTGKCMWQYSISSSKGPGGEFHCESIANFEFLPWMVAQYQFYCTLNGDRLNCEIKPGFWYATKMQCIRID